MLDEFIKIINNPLELNNRKDIFFKDLNLYIISINDFIHLQQVKNKILNSIKIQLSLLKSESLENKKIISNLLNELKQYIFNIYNERKSFLEDDNDKEYSKDDLLLPSTYKVGELHPITITIHKIHEIMENFNFSMINATEVDDPKNIFDNLNMDKLHPAREDQQSFSFKNTKLIPRTQTTNFQSKILNNWNEIDIISYYSCGHVYRYDSDATHTPKFTQFEIMYVNHDANISTLLGFIDKFFYLFFGYEVKSRIRTSYFPFTEISYEVDIFLNNRWLEMGGSGIIHKKVFENHNKKYTNGFAWGMGIERLTMVANDYKDIRKFYEN